MSNSCNIYPSSPQNLEEYSVLVEDNHLSPQIFDIQIIPKMITYGKHLFAIGILDSHPDYKLKFRSDVRIEIKDFYGKVIYHELIPTETISGAGVGFIWLREDLAQYVKLDTLEDNISTMVVLGELEGVPSQWEGVFNVRMKIPFMIRKSFPNISPLYFNTKPQIQIIEEFDSDLDGNHYSRSFASFKIDKTSTIGGLWKYGEISYLPSSASTDNNKILDTFEVTSSIEVLRDTISNVNITGLLDDTGDSNQTVNNQWIGNFSSSLQIYNWKTFGGQISGDDSMLPSALLQTAADKNLCKIFRYAHDNEEYTIQFKMSGSGEVYIKTSPFQSDLTSSLITYGDDTLNIITEFSQSFIKFNPDDNLTWTSSNFDIDKNLISGSTTAVFKSNFCIPSGSYAAIWLNCTGTSDDASWSDVSIKSKTLAGVNPPFYYHKIQLPSHRRNDNYNFIIKFLNPDMEVSQDIIDTGVEMVMTSSNNFFTGSPSYFELDDNLMLGALKSPGYQGYTEANSSPITGSAGFILYSGSILSNSDSSNLYHNGGVGLELAGGIDSGSLRFNTITGKLEITGSFQTTGDGEFGGTISASAGSIGGWNIASDNLYHSESTHQMILSGSKGTIHLLSGSDETQVLQIASDISEDSGDPLATPGMFVQDGIIFLKRLSGSMPAGSKSGTSDFIQQGTRIKPGFINIQNSGSVSDEYQRLDDGGSVFKIRSINQDHSTGDTYGMVIDRFQGYGTDTPNNYNLLLKNESLSGSSIGLKIDFDTNNSETVNGANVHQPLFIHCKNTAPGGINENGNLYWSTIQNSHFLIRGESEERLLWVSPSSRSIVASSDKNLGSTLGTTSDNLNYFFQVIRDGLTSDIPNSKSPFRIGSTGGSYPNFFVTNHLLVSSSGYIGIGPVTYPTEQLHVSGNILATGDIIANQYIVSSSVTYMTQSFSSGSTIFGDTLDDTHNFTGSVNITGSLTLNGDSITGGGGSSPWYDGTTYLSSSVDIQVKGKISGSGDLIIGDLAGNYISASNGNLEISDELRVSRIVATGSGQVSEIYDNLNIFGSVGSYIHIEDTSTGAGIQRIEFDDYYSTYPGEIRRYGTGTGLVGSEESLNFFTNNSRHLMISGSSTTAVGIGISLSADEPNPIPKTLTVRGDISASGDLDVTNISSSANIYAPNIGSGTDNSVVILDSDGTFKTDEINPKVWDSDTLLNSVGLSSGYIPVSDNGNEMDNSNLYWESNKLGIGTGAVTPSKTLTVNGDISGSGDLFISGSGGESIFGTVNSSGNGGSGNQKITIGVDGDQSASIHLKSANINWEIATSKAGFTPNGGLLFRYGGTDKHAFDNDGNFGINTTSPTKTLTVNGDISGSGELNIQGNITASNIAGTLTTSTQDNISQIYNTSLKIGRDSQNLIDFATVDNNIIFRINNADELKLLFNSLQPYTSNGLALGSTSNQWSDLYLYEGGVINWDNGDVTMTQTGNQLDIEGTTLTTFEGDISGSGNFILGDLAGGSYISASNGNLELSGSGTGLIQVDGDISGSGVGYINTGWHGSQTRIKLLARDFHPDDDVGRALFIEDDTSNDISFRAHAAQGLYASVPIPEGFSATAVMVYGSDTSNSVKAYEGNINTPDVTGKDGGSCVVGTECDITDVDATDTNFLWVKVEPGGGTDLLYGGYITIEKI